jgi:hypothetical protein
MSHADVVQFLKGRADRDVVTVWRPGLDDWKSASHLFDVVAPVRLVDASKEASGKQRYSLYGVYLGVSVVLADYLLQWRGSKFQPWTGNGVAENIGYIIGTLAVSVFVGFIVGGIVDFATAKSRRKSVLDPGTFEEPEIILKIPLDPSRRNNFIARYWRGEYSLGVSYWWFGFVSSIAAAALAAGILILFRVDRGYDPRAIFGTFVCIWLVIIVFTVWQIVGVWRSASRHTAHRRAVGKRAGWATAAKITCVLILLATINTLVTAGWPQLVETSRIAFLDDPDIPAYSIRVMRNGTEAEITGGFKYGLTDDFSKVLKASRQIKVVHLDSDGGRIGEAIRLNDVLRDQGVNTYVSHGCYSACTVAFAAGRHRIIEKGAVLGFHGPAFPGMTDRELQDASLNVRSIFIKAGFDRDFVDKALSTPSSDMWTPSAYVLMAAHATTGLSDGTDFAVSGFGANFSKDRAAAMLADVLPVVAALKQRFPKRHDAVIDAFYDDYLAGKTEVEAFENVRAKIRSLVSTLQPLADDSVLADKGALLADQYAALGAKSPVLCYRYASRSGVQNSLAGDLPDELVDREDDIHRRIVETAKEREDVSPKVVGSVWTKLNAQIAAKGVGDDQLKLLTGGSVEPARYAEYCHASATIYREIARQPKTEAGILMRSLLGFK